MQALKSSLGHLLSVVPRASWRPRGSSAADNVQARCLTRQTGAASDGAHFDRGHVHGHLYVRMDTLYRI